MWKDNIRDYATEAFLFLFCLWKTYDSGNGRKGSTGEKMRIG